MSAERFKADKAVIRAELEKRARARETITYGEAGALVGRLGQGLGPILDAIKAEELAKHRPDLSCLVVHNRSNLPTYVGRDVEERKRAISLRRKVFHTWAKLK